MKTEEETNVQEIGFGPDNRYNDYPYIVTKIEGALQHICLLSEKLSTEELLEAAVHQEAANKLPTCLVVAKDDCYFINNGKVERSNVLPFTTLRAYGRLFVPDRYAASPERQRLLEAASKKKGGPGGYILGDPRHGGRKPVGDELERLSGKQENGIPKGLEQCPVCGKWRGECLYNTHYGDQLVITVSCECDNDNLCARCGQKLSDEKLKSNYINEKDLRPWYVPGFCGLSHVCPDKRKTAYGGRPSR